MSSTLDLDGMTVTVNAHETLSVYQITDTSAGHNGALILEECAQVIFDDTAGAGFAAAATNIVITSTGISSNHAIFCSASVSPTNLWTMPELTVTIIAVYTDFFSYIGATSSPTWSFTNCNLIAPTSVSSAAVLLAQTMNDHCLIYPYLGNDADGLGTPVYGAPRSAQCRIFRRSARQPQKAGEIQSIRQSAIWFSAYEVLSLKDLIEISDVAGVTQLQASYEPMVDGSGSIAYKRVMF